MVALFSTSLLHANITYEANAAVVQQQSVCKGTVVDNNGLSRKKVGKFS